MSIFCNGSTHLSNKPECQQKGLNWSISFISGPFIGYQHPGDLLVSILSWSLFSEREEGELSAGNTRICNRANKNNSRKRGRIQGGVEAEANLEGPLYPERPCVPGFSLMTSSWVGSPIMAPGRVAQSRTELKGLSLPAPSEDYKKSDQAKPLLLTGLLVNSFLHHLMEEMYASTAYL